MLAKKPNSRRNLDIAIRRLAGSDADAIKLRTTMANTIVGQMMPSGVVKGGSSLKIRFGDSNTRFTTDFDMARVCDLNDFVYRFGINLEKGWGGFTGRIVRQSPATPEGVPSQYVMQPFNVKLDYNGSPWCTIGLEIGHDEIGDADEAEYLIDASIADLFSELALPSPSPVPLMPLPYQIAQKLHGVSESGSKRAHDLIDLQIIVACGSVDWKKTKDICGRLFSYRRAQAWPPTILKGEGWDALYFDQAAGLGVIQDVDGAVAWANDLVAKINES